MASSLTFLVRHFMLHPEHHFLISKKIAQYEQLKERFEALKEEESEEEWLHWFELFERVAPFLVEALVQEVSAMLYGSAPDLDAFSSGTADMTVAEGSQPPMDFGPETTQAALLEQSAPDQELKRIALQNSARVYDKGEGWNDFFLDLASGEILEEDDSERTTKPLRCRLSFRDGKMKMDELRLHFSERRTLFFMDQKWYWRNTHKFDRPVKMDIKDMSRVLPARVVDLLLDLVSPGLFFQAADASISASVSRKDPPEEEVTPGQREQALSKVGPRDAAPPAKGGDKIVMTKSPFAERPISEEEAETTMSRKAITCVAGPLPAPKELIIERVLPPSWWARLWGKRHSERRELLDVVQIGEARHFQEWGLIVTFLIESTAETVFPWVSVEREPKTNAAASVSLRWNQEQTFQPLAPGYKSVGALSRSPLLSGLEVLLLSPQGEEVRLLIHWAP